MARLFALATASSLVVANAGDTSDWCDCGTGINSMEVWDQNNPDDRHKVASGGNTPVTFKAAVGTVSWVCDGMGNNVQQAILVKSTQWSVSLHTNSKGCGLGHKDSGRIEFKNFGEVVKPAASYPVVKTSVASGSHCPAPGFKKGTCCTNKDQPPPSVNPCPAWEQRADSKCCDGGDGYYWCYPTRRSQDVETNSSVVV